MATLNVRIFNTLRDLSKDDFSVFKWLLQQPVLPGLKTLTRSALEDADRKDTADLIVQAYPDHAVQIMVNVLQEIQRADLLQDFSDIHKGREKRIQESKLILH